MSYLLDTAVFVWSLREPERLNKIAFEILEDDNHEVFFSAVSSWEIVIKNSIGKLALPKDPAQFIGEALIRFSMHPLAITHQHSFAVMGLAFHHRDPFDRMLVAQAKSENMGLMTVDETLKKYPIKTLWCGK